MLDGALVGSCNIYMIHDRIHEKELFLDVIDVFSEQNEYFTNYFL